VRIQKDSEVEMQATEAKKGEESVSVTNELSMVQQALGGCLTTCEMDS